MRLRLSPRSDRSILSELYASLCLLTPALPYASLLSLWVGASHFEGSPERGGGASALLGALQSEGAQVIITLSLIFIAWKIREIVGWSQASLLRDGTLWSVCLSLGCLWVTCISSGYVLGAWRVGLIEKWSARQTLQLPYDAHLKKQRWLMKVKAIQRRGARWRVSLRLIDREPLELGCQLWTDELEEGIARGATVWLNGVIEPHRLPPSSLDFNPMTYGRRRGALWRCRGVILPRDLPSGYALWRRALHERLYESFTLRGPGGALVIGLTLGDPSLLPDELRSVFMESGLGHLLAVSGLHVGALALLCAWLARLLCLLLGGLRPYRWSAIGAILCAWSMLELAQWPLSAQRAALMISIYYGAQLIERSISGPRSLLITSALLTAGDPTFASELGVQLSLSAVYGLCLWTPNAISWSSRWSALCAKHIPPSSSEGWEKGRARRLLERVSAWWARALMISTVTWLFTAPVQAWHLGTLSPLSPAVNTLLTPIASALIIPIALFGVLTSSITELGVTLASAVSLCFIEAVKALPSALSQSVIIGRWFALPLGALTLSWICWRQARALRPEMILLRALIPPGCFESAPEVPLREAESLSHRCARLSFYCALFSLCCVSLMKHPTASSMISSSTRDPQVIFLSVGQGDATLILNGEGGAALFDVGPPSAGPRLLSLLSRLGIAELDFIALSHLHPDHYGGLEPILKRLRVGQVLYHGRSPIRLRCPSSESAPPRPSNLMPTWGSFEERLTALEIPLTSPKIGLMRWGEVNLEWLWINAERALSENDASLALVISRDATEILLSGDLEAQGEARLRRVWRLRAERAMGAQRGAPSTPPVTLWQANHHGSRTSTHPETLKQIAPRAVILSLGERNRFGFPHPEVIKRLSDRSISQWRLDLEGHIVAGMTSRGLSVGALGR